MGNLSQLYYAYGKQTMHQFSYTSQSADSTSAIAQWHFYSTLESRSLVLPDGCRDIIVKENTDSAQTYFISDLSSSTYRVVSSAGTSMRGIRLQPGVQVNEGMLNAWLSAHSLEQLFSLDQLDEFCYRSERIAEALDCIASDAKSIACVAKQLGVSTRSLQRVVKSETGVTPVFWLALSRARKAARALFENKELSSIALQFGFSDQAHMNREMKRWFNMTPGQIRANDEIVTLLAERGYG